LPILGYLAEKSIGQQAKNVNAKKGIDMNVSFGYNALAKKREAGGGPPSLSLGEDKVENPSGFL